MQSVQLLGEIDTHVVRIGPNARKLCPQEQVYLEVEPVDGSAERRVRVEDGQLELIGRLAPQASSWLAPLVDVEAIRVDGYVPGYEHFPMTIPAGADPLRLIVFATACGGRILGERLLRTKEDALHETIRYAYERAQTFATPELVLDFADSLRCFAEKPLLPETHLLLALIPGVARELRAAQLMLGRHFQPALSQCNATH